MARMYPNQLAADTESRAERHLYEAFRDELDSSYTVFHSVNWQSLEPDGRPRDGEADFVIAHPKRGILVMEAKAGTIRCNSRTGHWTSTDRSGRVHSIKDPFAQARDSKYTLLEQLRIMLNQPQRHINLGHAVAFPDVVVGQVLPGLDKPRPIILDAADLPDIPGWVGRALAYYRGQANQAETAPGEDTVQVLTDLLGKSWELRPALWGDFVQEEQQLVRLTEQQYLLLDMLSRQRRAAICGCAGSGKTMLAAEKASRLARQSFRTLLTCFNINLATDLRARLRHSNLDIVHFHGLCEDLANQAGVLPASEDERAYYDRLLPEALMRAADQLSIRYDAIIVDEGQDFLEDWWIPLQMLLRDPDGGILYIFYDDNQRIYKRQGALPIEGEPYPLTINCRNTQAIHRTVLRFYEGDVLPTTRGPKGRPIEVIDYGKPERLGIALQETLRRLSREDRIPSDEVAVLTPLSPRKSQLWQSPVGRSGLTEHLPPPTGMVYCTTIYKFKGLEQAVIILAEIDLPWLRHSMDLEMLLYVGCSRARHHLIVLLSDEADPAIREAFAKR